MLAFTELCNLRHRGIQPASVIAMALPRMGISISSLCMVHEGKGYFWLEYWTAPARKITEAELIKVLEIWSEVEAVLKVPNGAA